MGKDKKAKKGTKRFSPLDKRPPAPVPKGAFDTFVAKKQQATDKRTAKYLEQSKSSGVTSVKNVTKIASVMQNKAFMKRENRYKQLFRVDEDEMEDTNLLEMTHIARDDEFQDEGDKFIEFVAEDVQSGQVHPRVLQQLNDDPAGLGRQDSDDEDGKKKKSKREIFKEMIRKSKYEKMVRQKANAEQSDKVKQLDDMFSSLFPELNLSGLDKKSKSSDLKEYDKLRAQLQFEPSLTPLHLAKEGDGDKKKKNKEKRKKVDVDQLSAGAKDKDESSSEASGSGAEEGEEEGEEEEYESYEDSGEDVERLHEGEVKVRKFNSGARTKLDRVEENYGKAMKNLKLLGDLEDELLGKYMKDIDDIEGEEEDEEGDEEGMEGDEEDGEEEGEFEDGDEEDGEEEEEEEEEN